MKLLLLTAAAALLGMGTPRLVTSTAATAPPATSAPAAVAPPKPGKATSDRDKMVTLAVTQIGTQERTGHNDGPVDKYLAAVGLGGTRNPYCAAFVYWTGRNALGSKNPVPKSAWSPDFGSSPATATISAGRPGDTFTIYHANLGRIGHTGLVRGWQGRYLWTVEANTSPSAATLAEDRDATTKGGVWSKLRDPRTVYRIKSWLP